jgi:4-diphosphocytidyl-2-C-methyl-D-erythritol kinase
MGGGSSNAATVLMGLNEMLRINLSKDKLIKIGVRFGADVPFFLLESPAIARGVGDQLSKIKKMPKLPMVVITPNIKVPTKWVFEKYAASNDNKPARKPAVTEEIPDQFTTKKSIIKFLNNDLEDITIGKYPVLNDIKKVLTKLGAIATQMTGSGPTVFGIFPDTETAQNAANKLSKSITDCRVFFAENL